MKAQLFQVFRTYSCRPLVRLFAAIALLLAMGLFAQGFFPGAGNVPIEPEIEMAGNMAAILVREWDDYFQNHAPAELDSLRLTDLAIPRGLEQQAGMFPDLTSLVNLTSLKLDSANLTLPKVKEVQSLESLQSLALQAPSIPKGTWTALGPKLRRLEVPLRLLLSRPDEVSQLVELRMLRVDRVGLTPEALSVIAQIPNLKHLVLSYGLVDTYEDQSDSRMAIAPFQLTPATLRPLAGHPSLEAVFAHWPRETPRTSPALPGVRLYPSGFPSLWQSAIMLGVFFTAAFAAIVALQVWAHFVAQSAAVVPGYARPHQIAALTISFGGTLVGAAGLWWAGIAAVPALVIALAFPTAFAIPSASQSTSQAVRNVVMPLAILATLVFWFPLVMVFVLPPVIAGEYTWFLRGEFGLIGTLIFIVEIALLGYALVQLPAITRRVYETSSLPPGLSPWDPQQQRRSTYSSKHWWMGLWDRGEQYDQLRGDSNWRKARLWRAGNAYRPRNIVMFSGMFVVFFIAMQMLMGGGGRLSDPGMWHAVMAQLGAMILIFPPIAWHQRSRSLQIESLRPVRRKDFIRQLYIALALDQSLALIPFGVAIALSIAFPRQGGSTAESYIFLALGLAGLAWAYALSTAVFAIKRAWVFAGFIVAMIVLPNASLVGFAFIIDEPQKPADQHIVLISFISLAVFALAAGILWATYRRSLRREWG